MEKNLNIYHYEDAFKYLYDSYVYKKEKNPSFSLRSWARNLGLKSHSPLQLMISGKRSISIKYIPKFIKSLSLSFNEGMYLENLIQMNQAKSLEEKELYLGRINELRPKITPLNSLELETFKFLQDPLHCLILEMSELKVFKNEPKWIKDRIHLEASINEIKEAITRLGILGLINIDKNKKITKNHQHITNTIDVADLATQKYHKNVLDLAKKAIDQQKIDEREFNSFCFNIDKNEIPELKKQVRRFIQNFIRKNESKSKHGNETYQLNVQLFSLTKNKEKK